MKIEQAISQAQSMDELHEIAKKAKAGMSILGHRFISVEGHEGCASRHALAAGYFKLERELQLDGRLSEVTVSISRVHENLDQLLQNSFCIKKILCCVREFFADLFFHGFIYNPRSNWDFDHLQNCELSFIDDLGILHEIPLNTQSSIDNEPFISYQDKFQPESYFAPKKPGRPIEAKVLIDWEV